MTEFNEIQEGELEKIFEINKIGNEIDGFIEKEGLVCKTEMAAVKLTLFKSIFTDKFSFDNEEQRKIMRAKCEKIMKHEKDAKELVDLPTVGTELEIPYEVIPDRDFFDNLLTMLKIPHYEERDKGGGNYFEVNQNFSYSAYTQSRIIEDLVEMGILGKIPNEGQKYSEKLLSLHVNLGVPDRLGNLNAGDIEESPMFHEIDLLTNSLAYGYVSPERIENKKTQTSWQWTNIDSVRNEKGGGRRLEITIGELGDLRTFRMLEEVQRLGGIMFEYMAEISGKRFMEKLKNQWGEFRTEMKTIFNKFGVQMNLYELKRRHEAAEFAGNADFREAVRHTMHKFASLDNYGKI